MLYLIPRDKYSKSTTVTRRLFTMHPLLLVFLVDAGIQILFYVVSAALHTEKLYDLSGALTYIACTLVALLARDDPLIPRQIIAAALTLVWCSRLGYFLFRRVLRVEDKRFDSLKTNPLKFMIPWFLQIIWIYLTALPVFVVVTNRSVSQNVLQWSDYIGIIIWAFGFAVEAIADYQKSVFKTANPADFISTGLWKYSRYANYFGEVTLWCGMWILCAAGFYDNWQFFTIICPVFVFCLIYFVSGVKLSEVNSESRYGSRAGFQYLHRLSNVQGSYL
jgi:steroid 5-alpha reductase family enzyme